ncbi:hypothetical protein [Microcoleus sp. CZ3-B4]|uniref:hypothetical protein n=1 Tax=Microcoleus sp. CZ3-B4 TaxID=2818733 RepID=UPI002FCF1855
MSATGIEMSRGSAIVSQLPPEILPSSLSGRRRTQTPALGLKHLSEKPRFLRKSSPGRMIRALCPL